VVKSFERNEDHPQKEKHYVAVAPRPGNCC